MGKSYFAFLIRSQEDLKSVYDLKLRHDTSTADDDVGEKLVMEYALYFDSEYWLVLGNYGGGDLTMRWLYKNKDPKMVILWPFEKPEGYDECKNVYEGNEMKEKFSKLPASTPDTECKYKPRSPPKVTFREHLLNTIKERVYKK